jgi:hypothetical protein
MRQRPARRACDRVKAAKRLPDLRFEARPDQLTGLRIEPDLSRREDDESGFDSLRVRTDAAGAAPVETISLLAAPLRRFVDEGSSSEPIPRLADRVAVPSRRETA